MVAWCDSMKGREAACRRHLDERAVLTEQMGLVASAHAALGLLQLGNRPVILVVHQIVEEADVVVLAGFRGLGRCAGRGRRRCRVPASGL